LTGDDPVIDQLRGIWAEIFMRRNFDPSDDFFEIGGDSLAVAICNALIEEELGILLPISLHYEATTLGELAEAVQVRISAPPANDSTRPAQP
jgi:acyl carrier protein